MPDPRACVRVRPSDGGRKREERLVEAGRAKGVLIMQGPSYLTDVLGAEEYWDRSQDAVPRGIQMGKLPVVREFCNFFCRACLPRTTSLTSDSVPWHEPH